MVLLPADNTDGDTDTELGNDSDMTDMTIETGSEISGRIEIQTSKQTSKIKKPEGLNQRIQKHGTGICRRIRSRKLLLGAFYLLAKKSIHSLNALRGWKTCANGKPTENLMSIAYNGSGS